MPVEWHGYKIWVAVLGVLLLTALNMRGVREAVIPLLPVFLLFLATHVFAIAYSIFSHVGDMGRVAAQTAQQVRGASSELGVVGMLLLMLHAYSMGAGTFTGIEAVSNGLPMLREPRAQTGKRTMIYMATSLVIAVIGLMIAYMLSGAVLEEGKTLNATMLERLTAHWSRNTARTFVLLTLVSETAILFVAAQAGFLGGPRVLANMALDRWFPSRFAMLSDRLVTQNGVVLMGGAALIVMAFARGSVQYLVVLYSITVFITFVLAQLGMVRHWWRLRGKNHPWLKGIAINGTGLVLTAGILISMTIIKFREGGWITLAVTGGLVALALFIRRHYDSTRRMLGRLDSLVEATKATVERLPKPATPAGAYDPDAKTAIVLVNGFNGLGLHTLFSIVRTFGGAFRQFVFLQVGAVDAGNFKGAEEMERLRQFLDAELAKYVAYMNAEGYYAESHGVVGTDIVEEIVKLSHNVLERFPQGVFFGGQLVFPEETAFTRLLHNYIVFAVQRRLYSRGVPFMILPIRV